VAQKNIQYNPIVGFHRHTVEQKEALPESKPLFYQLPQKTTVVKIHLGDK
jgi:hypothetical protein